MAATINFGRGRRNRSVSRGDRVSSSVSRTAGRAMITNCWTSSIRSMVVPGSLVASISCMNRIAANCRNMMAMKQNTACENDGSGWRSRHKCRSHNPGLTRSAARNNTDSLPNSSTAHHSASRL